MAKKSARKTRRQQISLSPVKDGDSDRDRRSPPRSRTHTESSIPLQHSTSGPEVRNRSSLFPGSESIDSVHSPYHLHSGDHPGMSIVSEILNGDNYNTWIIAMTVSIEAKNKLRFIDGSLLRPDVCDPLYHIWCRCNSMVKAWILNVVSKQIYASILYFQDAHEIWKDLAKRFHKSNLSLIYRLETDIVLLRQGSMDLASYYTAKVTLWEQLASTKPTIVAEAGDSPKVKMLIADQETSKIVQFLMGLNDEFATIRSTILNTKPRPSLSDIYNMLDEDESQRRKSSSSITPSVFNVQSAAQYDPQVNMATNSMQRNTGKPRPICSHCNKMGHTVDKCYKVHGYPPGWKPKGKAQISAATNMIVHENTSDATSMGNDLSKDQLQQIISFLSAKLQPSSQVTNFCEASTSKAAEATICNVSGSYQGPDDWEG